MPRQPRLIVAGYPHHINLRGNNRSAIFDNDKDRRFFLKCLEEAKKKTSSKIYAYCLMTNHVHLLIEPRTNNAISDMLQSLGRRYVRYINAAYKRTGTLWEGRFKSSLVSQDEYFLACIRYIELNPIRAKIAKELKDYPWSSFKFRAEGKSNSLLSEDPVYSALGKTPKERQEKYKEWLKKNISDEELNLIRNVTQRGGIFSSKDFFDKIAKITGRDVALKPRGRPRKSL